MEKATYITISDNVYTDVDVEVEIGIDDILEFVEKANKLEINQIVKTIQSKGFNANSPEPMTIADELKNGILVKAMNIYSIEELEKRLGISWI